MLISICNRVFLSSTARFVACSTSS
uniref:Uncharacterized protein n=1 Tax=Arundo donax TaxID=35708 RepID=A0A0A9EPV3_ARUDO